MTESQCSSMTGKPVLLNAIYTNSALFPMHQESEMASRKSSGSAKPLFAQVPPLPFTLHQKKKLTKQRKGICTLSTLLQMVSIQTYLYGVTIFHPPRCFNIQTFQPRILLHRSRNLSYLAVSIKTHQLTSIEVYLQISNPK